MKILIINTQSMNHDNATGVTLRSIFSRYPIDNIMELYMQPCVKAKESLAVKSLKLEFASCPIRTLASRVYQSTNTKLNKSSVQASGCLLKERIKARLIMAIDFEPVFLTKNVRRIIRNFQPNCIYTLGNAIDIMKYVYKVAEEFQINILPHFMDNWQESHRYGEDKYPCHLKVTQFWLKKIYSKSVCALAISQKMAEVYEKRWNKKHYALMNTIDVKKFCCISEKEDCRVISYVGGLHLNRYKSLMEIAKAIDIINSDKSMHLILKIFTDEKSINRYSDKLMKYHCVELHEYVPHDKIVEIYKISNILVHIETFDLEYRSFIMYSLSTKISEYLASGRAIFLYAPNDIFVSEYLKQNNAAETVSDKDKLVGAIKHLLFDEQYKNIICKNALSLAFQNHDIKSTRQVFEKAVNESIEIR